MNNFEKPKELDYIRVEKRNRNLGAKALEDSRSERSASHSTRSDKNTAERRRVSPNEIRKARNIIRKALINIGAGVATTAALVGGGIILGESSQDSLSPQEKWENQMTYELAGYSDLHLDYSEEGSYIEFTGKTREGEDCFYYLDDVDNDSLIESGHLSSNRKTAEFSSDTGVTLRSAIHKLDSQIK